MQFHKGHTITSKFIFWFLIISSIPLTVAIFISYTISSEALREEIKDSLQVVADNRASRIEQYLLKKKEDGSTLSYSAAFIDAIEKSVNTFATVKENSNGFLAVITEFKPMLMYYQNLFGYDNMLLVNTEGRVVFSMEKSEKISSFNDKEL
ncbi:MAG: hypothetical protein KKC84_06220, partial [Candidatus Omnitrophica bacterium]|nr:hypothetical protein [Candidatus Omnitrophota bacterium]